MQKLPSRMVPPHLQERAGGRWQTLSLGLEDDQEEGVAFPWVGSLPPSPEALDLALDHLSRLSWEHNSTWTVGDPSG